MKSRKNILEAFTAAIKNCILQDRVTGDITEDWEYKRYTDISQMHSKGFLVLGENWKFFSVQLNKAVTDLKFIWHMKWLEK